MKPSQRWMWTPRSYLRICEVSTLRKGDDTLYYYSARIAFRENLHYATFDSLISKSAVSNWPNQESKPAALLVSSAMQDLGGPCCLLPSKIVPRLHLTSASPWVLDSASFSDICLCSGRPPWPSESHSSKFRNGTVPARLLPEMGHDQAIKCQGRGNESERPGIHSVESLLPRPVCVVSKHALLTEISNKCYEKSNQNALRI